MQIINSIPSYHLQSKKQGNSYYNNSEVVYYINSRTIKVKYSQYEN